MEKAFALDVPLSIALNLAGQNACLSEDVSGAVDNTMTTVHDVRIYMDIAGNRTCTSCTSAVFVVAIDPTTLQETARLPDTRPDGFASGPSRAAVWRPWAAVLQGRMPQQYRSHQHVVNHWRSHGLPDPPRGQQWVQVGSAYVLIAVATGIIAQLVLR
ncbi:MAG: hypothetical protein JWR74_813 [Polaromonas sp.]|nr:hypothetical protein [Polaromonas sp.]